MGWVGIITSRRHAKAPPGGRMLPPRQWQRTLLYECAPRVMLNITPVRHPHIHSPPERAIIVHPPDDGGRGGGGAELLVCFPVPRCLCGVSLARPRAISLSVPISAICCWGDVDVGRLERTLGVWGCGGGRFRQPTGA